MSWVEIHSNLPDHPKTIAAAHALGIDRDMLAGKLTRLWTWAIDYRESGFFADFEAGLIAEKMRWTKPSKKLIDALLYVPQGYTAGFLDRVEGGYLLHDWKDYSGKLVARREKDRRRKSAQNPDDNREAPHRNSGGDPGENPEGLQQISEGIPSEMNGNSGCYHNRNHNQYKETGDKARTRAREAVAFWEEISGAPASGALLLEIDARACSGCDMELVHEALRLSVGKSSPASYFTKCLQNWRADGVTSYQAYCDRYRTPLPQKGAQKKQSRSFSELAQEMEGTA